MMEGLQAPNQFLDEVLKLGEKAPAAEQAAKPVSQTDLDIVINHLTAITDGLSKATVRLTACYTAWAGKPYLADEEETAKSDAPAGKYGSIIQLLAEQHRQIAALEKQITNFERMV